MPAGIAATFGPSPLRPARCIENMMSYPRHPVILLCVENQEAEMNNMTRRNFLRAAGKGVLAAAAAAVAHSSGAVEAAPVQRSTPVMRICALANVNIRLNASIYSAKVGMLYVGQTAPVLAVSSDLNWWCIRWGRRSYWVTADPRWIVPISWRR